MVTDPAKIQKFLDFNRAVGAALHLDLGPLSVAAREPDGLQTLPHFGIVQPPCNVTKAPKLPAMCCEINYRDLLIHGPQVVRML